LGSIQQPFHLNRDSVHVWTIQLDPDEALAHSFEAILSDEEIARASRFLFPHLRWSYVVSHGCLRLLLARYLGIAPAAVRFLTGPKGKPHLADPGSIQFNLSHSGNLALIAVALDCEIGVDIEKIRSVRDLRGIATRFFCPEEMRELLSLPPSDQELGFFLCWTRKEAYLKACGEGLHVPLDSFRVTLAPGGPVRFVHIGNSEPEAANWALHEIPSLPGYAAALAYRDAPREVRTFNLLAASATSSFSLHRAQTEL